MAAGGAVYHFSQERGFREVLVQLASPHAQLWIITLAQAVKIKRKWHSGAVLNWGSIVTVRLVYNQTGRT